MVSVVILVPIKYISMVDTSTRMHLEGVEICLYITDFFHLIEIRIIV